MAALPVVEDFEVLNIALAKSSREPPVPAGQSFLAPARCVNLGSGVAVRFEDLAGLAESCEVWVMFGEAFEVDGVGVPGGLVGFRSNGFEDFQSCMIVVDRHEVYGVGECCCCSLGVDQGRR